MTTLNRPSDYVTFKLSSGEDYKNQNCYAMGMLSWSSSTFTCHPNGPNLMPFDMYERWMNLCKKNGLVIEDAVVSKDGDSNVMVVNASKTSRHELMATLCCYRWADTLGDMVSEMLDIIDTRPELNFYQVLHHGLMNYITNWNHSISMLMKKNPYNKTNTSDLAHSLAPCFAFTKVNGTPAIRKYSSASGSWTIHGIYNTLKGFPNYIADMYNGVSYPDAIAGNCLDEKFTKLYSMLGSDFQTLKKALE